MHVLRSRNNGLRWVRAVSYSSTLGVNPLDRGAVDMAQDLVFVATRFIVIFLSENVRTVRYGRRSAVNFRLKQVGVAMSLQLKTGPHNSNQMDQLFEIFFFALLVKAKTKHHLRIQPCSRTLHMCLCASSCSSPYLTLP